MDILSQSAAVKMAAADGEPAAVEIPYSLAIYRLAGKAGDSPLVIHSVVTGELPRWPECWIEFMQ